MTAHALARLFGLITTTATVACHQGAPKRSQVLPESGIIGDSTGFAARIIALNAGRDRATIALEKPAYLVLLAVSPGKSIEPVNRGVSPDTAMTPAGVHSLRVVAREAPEPLDPPRLLDVVDYQRCIDQYVRARTRPKPKRVVRDSSTGTVIEVEPVGEPEVPLDVERQAERACSRILRRPGPQAPRYRERYLVVIASHVRLTLAQLEERLDAMSVTASDVPATIAAVGDALYFDKRAVWSGYFTRW